MIRRLIAAVAGVLLTVGLLTGVAPKASAVKPVTVMTWNVHGSKDRAGAGNGGDPAKLLPELLATVRKYKPSVIALQELCHRQHRKFRAELAKLGYQATMTHVDKSSGCNDKKEGNISGNSLYLRTASIAWRSSAALPWGINPVGTVGRQPRRVVAARMAGSPVVYGGVHLSPGDPDNTAQLRKALTSVQGWAKGAPVVLLGDLNRSGASAVALCPAGWTATGNTVDQVLLSSGSAKVRAVIKSKASDHPQVLVDVTI